MTDERADAEPKSASPESARSDEDHRQAVLAVMSALTERGHLDCLNLDLDLILAFLGGNFSSAFMQALGQRAADGTVKRVGNLVQTRVRRKGKPDETRIGVDDGSAATIAITEDTPDEARLALLDLDVTADELRGKVLRWDSSASAWRPDDDQ